MNSIVTVDLGKIDSDIANHEREIAELREFRKRVMANALPVSVTTKPNKRGVGRPRKNADIRNLLIEFIDLQDGEFSNVDMKGVSMAMAKRFPGINFGRRLMN